MPCVWRRSSPSYANEWLRYFLTIFLNHKQGCHEALNVSVIMVFPFIFRLLSNSARYSRLTLQKSEENMTRQTKSLRQKQVFARRAKPVKQETMTLINIKEVLDRWIDEK